MRQTRRIKSTRRTNISYRAHGVHVGTQYVSCNTRAERVLLRAAAAAAAQNVRTPNPFLLTVFFSSVYCSRNSFLRVEYFNTRSAARVRGHCGFGAIRIHICTPCIHVHVYYIARMTNRVQCVYTVNGFAILFRVVHGKRARNRRPIASETVRFTGGRSDVTLRTPTRVPGK